MTSWLDPRGGQGTWQPTRAHENGLTDLVVAFLACLLAGVLFTALVVAGRSVMCDLHDQQISYCPGYQPAATR